MLDEDYKRKYEEYLNVFSSFLSEATNGLDASAPQNIVSAMRYATQNGGKRVRPVLCLAANDALGGKFEDVKEFAVAIECIHAYSLVHDDLPAMDNDDFRRGKPSTHKKFGEATGILAGDALLNFAFEYMLSKKEVSDSDVASMKTVAESVGYRGMIAGQVLDMECEKLDCFDEKLLYTVYENKTSKLLTAPLLVASIKNGGKYYDELKTFGCELGITFQIIDDILDEESVLSVLGKTPRKDKEANKLTSIKVFGLEGAKEKAREHYLKCLAAVSKTEKFEFLAKFAQKLYERKF